VESSTNFIKKWYWMTSLILHFDFSMPTIAETIENAVQYHQGGHLPLAEKLYKKVLQNDPNNPVALHSLGVIAHQREKDDTAVELIGKAIANSPQIPQFHNTLGLVFEALGKFEEAVATYQQAVSIKPDYAEAYHNMAIALKTQGQYAAAVEKCKQAISAATAIIVLPPGQEVGRYGE
jgi:Flp pilus assembly protein TadD